MGKVTFRRPLGSDGPGGGVEPPSVYPLTVDGRWIRYADGSPLLVNGDTAWSIMAQLDQEEASVYLEDRAAKGVNMILCSLIEAAFSDQTPRYRNAYGEDPFTDTISAGRLDFTKPNEDYWAHVDWIIQEAERLGIIVFALPAYVGWEHGSEGWAATIGTNGTTRMAAYGTWLGERYAGQGNLIWCMGGDADAVFGGSDLSDEINALAEALKTADPDHLMTAHAGSKASRAGGYDEDWLDFECAYPGSTVSWLSNLHQRVRAAYQTSPAMPVLMIEAAYGNEHSTTDLYLRKQMWQSILGGAFGHFYGNAPTWYFGRDSSHPANGFADQKGLDWEDVLDDFGAEFLPYVARLQAARDLSQLTPDYSHDFVTAGYGSEGTEYAPVMASDSMLVAYTPGNALTVDRSEFLAETFNTRWFNPRDGSTQNAGTGTASFGSGSQVFTPPDSNDWVLLLDAQSLGLEAP